jgi:hypothetical protein
MIITVLSGSPAVSPDGVVAGGGAVFVGDSSGTASGVKGSSAAGGAYGNGDYQGLPSCLPRPN